MPVLVWLLLTYLLPYIKATETATDPSVISCRSDFYCYSSTQRFEASRCIEGYCRCPNVPNVNKETCLAHLGSCVVRGNGASAAARPLFRGANQTSRVKSCQANDSCAHSIHIISVYEATINHGFRQHLTGPATVHITADRNENDTRPIILILASYEPITWSLILQEGVAIDRVILSSHYIATSSVSGVSASSVEKLDWDNYLGYANGYNPDTVKQLEFVADRYGPVSSWTGTYRADEWRLHIDRRSCIIYPTGDNCSHTKATVTCPSLSPPGNGGITLTPEPDSLRLGSVATYSCDSGYTLIGQHTRTCEYSDGGNTGIWSGASPICQMITCSSLSPPGNGGITLMPEPNSLRLGSVATFSCDPGYALVGQSVRTCVVNTDGGSTVGTWSGTPPICEDELDHHDGDEDNSNDSTLIYYYIAGSITIALLVGICFCYLFCRFYIKGRASSPTHHHPQIRTTNSTLTQAAQRAPPLTTTTENFHQAWTLNFKKSALITQPPPGYLTVMGMSAQRMISSLGDNQDQPVDSTVKQGLAPSEENIPSELACDAQTDQDLPPAYPNNMNELEAYPLY